MAVAAIILGSIFGMVTAVAAWLFFGLPFLMAAGVHIAICCASIGITSFIALQEDIDELGSPVHA